MTNENREIKIKLSTFTIILAIIGVFIVGSISNAVNLRGREQVEQMREQQMEDERKVEDLFKSKTGEYYM